MSPLSNLAEEDQSVIFQLHIDERLITFLIREDAWQKLVGRFNQETPFLQTSFTDIAEEYIPVRGSWGFAYHKGERRGGGLSLIEKKATPGWQMIRAYLPSMHDTYDRADIRYALMLQLLSRQLMWRDFGDEAPSSDGEAQLVAFDSVMMHHTAAVEAILSPTCVRLLTEASDEERTAIAAEIDRYMLIGCQAVREVPCDPKDAGATTVIRLEESGELVVHLPTPFHRGGLDPELGQHGNGLRLMSHNVDTAQHQIALIAGLASLDQTVRDILL